MTCRGVSYLLTQSGSHENGKNPFTQKNKSATINSEETESEGAEFNEFHRKKRGTGKTE